MVGYGARLDRRLTASLLQSAPSPPYSFCQNEIAAFAATGLLSQERGKTNNSFTLEVDSAGTVCLNV